MIVTEWNEFKALDKPQLYRLMHRPIVIDGRNLYEAEEMQRLGFTYRAMGRGSGPAPMVAATGDDTSLPQHASDGEKTAGESQQLHCNLPQ